MDKIPLYCINGALGAGKTTVLKFLLSRPEFANARVIENEFASESVDTAALEQQSAKVATIAGSCICCSSGDELVEALREFAVTGAGPVIIESTGVANTLNVIEQLVLGDVFRQYRLVQSLYVLDALETDNTELPAYMWREAAAADIVLVSKLDQVSGRRRDLEMLLREQGLPHVVTMDHGKFSFSELGESSESLAYFASCLDEIETVQTPTYSVIDTQEMVLAPDTVESIWYRLRDRYGLGRMKGGITDGVRHWHIEATPRQYVSTSDDLPLTLVFIGERAHEITRNVFMSEILS